MKLINWEQVRIMVIAGLIVFLLERGGDEAWTVLQDGLIQYLLAGPPA